MNSHDEQYSSFARHRPSLVHSPIRRIQTNISILSIHILACLMLVTSSFWIPPPIPSLGLLASLIATLFSVLFGLLVDAWCISSCGGEEREITVVVG